MSIELSLIPHPYFNRDNYLIWHDAYKRMSALNIPHLLREMNSILEAFQSEVAFVKSDSTKPIVASYGAGPCIIVGASQCNTGFIAHFSHAEEVTVGLPAVEKFLQENLPKKKASHPIRLHLRGGVKRNPISEGIYKKIVQYVKQYCGSNLFFQIDSCDFLKSDADGSKSLYIDSRNGAMGPYDPLRDNPKYYRKLTVQDIQFAQESFEKKASVRLIYPCI